MEYLTEHKLVHREDLAARNCMYRLPISYLLIFVSLKSFTLHACKYWPYVVQVLVNLIQCSFVQAVSVIKVADFGLSENTYAKSYFRQEQTASVKLPIKWMAYESLTDGIFSEKTDVVSLRPYYPSVP